MGELNLETTFPPLFYYKDIPIEFNEECTITFDVQDGFPWQTVLNDGYKCVPGIEKVIFNDPATIVYWADGTKTVVKCQEGDTFSKENGLSTAIVKRLFGNTGSYNNIFKKWCN